MEKTSEKQVGDLPEASTSVSLSTKPTFAFVDFKVHLPARNLGENGMEFFQQA